jgi:hypothetical protein
MIAVKKIWITDSAVWIKTADGREACEKFSDYPRLRYATQQQREKYTADAFSIRWEEIDEDLSYEGFFRSKPTNTLYDLFMSHPEINASAVARCLGMTQSLLAQYISGAKKPSNERLELIKSEIRKIGKELSSIQ